MSEHPLGPLSVTEQAISVGFARQHVRSCASVFVRDLLADHIRWHDTVKETARQRDELLAACKAFGSCPKGHWTGCDQCQVADLPECPRRLARVAIANAEKEEQDDE